MPGRALKWFGARLHVQAVCMLILELVAPMVAPIDGHWWVLGIGVLNPVGIGYWGFGLGGYWVLGFWNSWGGGVLSVVSFDSLA